MDKRSWPAYNGKPHRSPLVEGRHGSTIEKLRSSDPIAESRPSSVSSMSILKLVAILISHFFVDAYASVFAPLAAIVRMAPTQIGVFATIQSLASSFTQLLFGYLADRGGLKRYVVGGLVVAAITMGLIGPLIDTPLALGSLLVIGGLGIAAFHPAGVVLAARSVGRQGALGVSLFLLAGTTGFAVGPVLLEQFIRKAPAALETLPLNAELAERLEAGHQALPLLALPGLLVAAFAWLVFASYRVAPQNRKRPALEAIPTLVRNHGREILPIYILVVARTLVQTTLVSFLPRLMVDRQYSDAIAAQSLTYFIFSGALGMLVVGYLVTRCNRKWIQAVSFVIGIPCLLAFLLLDVSLGMGLTLLTLGGFFALSTNSMHIIIGQEIAPAHASTLSSVMMGFGWGGAAVGPLAVSFFVPYVGLDSALAAVVAVPLLALPLTACLRERPSPKRVSDPRSDTEATTATDLPPSS